MKLSLVVAFRWLVGEKGLARIISSRGWKDKQHVANRSQYAKKSMHTHQHTHTHMHIRIFVHVYLALHMPNFYRDVCVYIYI